MTRYELFGRGFLMPCLVTCNVVTAARGAWPAVFFLSGAISWVWWGTVQATRVPSTAAQVSYSIGAAFGGVVGMVLGAAIGRLLA